MKVIDLLNKIAKGEEVPKNIKYNDFMWFWSGACQIYETIDGDLKTINLYNSFATDGDLNDEVEIIEEEKKIEELNLMFPIGNDIKDAELGGFVSIYNANLANIKHKIGELIDEVNKIKNKY